ncbi:MAG TPA: mechanosensitive ion channel family protein [Alphaproteobacteria bacterium]|nr:mechanosensitive ion channel family protein [Alphaproteobacteria bacterium]
MLRPALTALLLLLPAALPAGAQTRAPPATQAEAPPGLTQPQFDALVQAISGAVIERLAAQQVRPAAAPGAPAQADAASAAAMNAASAAAANAAPIERLAGLAAERLPAIAAAAPVLAEALPGLPDRLGGEGRFFLQLAGAALLLLLLEPLLSLALRPLRRRLMRRLDETKRSSAFFALFGFDIALWLPVPLLAWMLPALLAPPAAGARFAALVLEAAVAFRLYRLAFRLWLRPELAEARLVPVDAAEATALLRGLSFAAGLILAVRLWTQTLLAAGLPPDAVAAATLVNNLIVTTAMIALVLLLRRPGARWLAGLIDPAQGTAPVKAALAGAWWVGGIAFFLAVSAAHLYGVVSAHFQVAAGLNTTQTLLLGLLFFETVVFRFVQHQVKPGTGEPWGIAVAARCLQVTVRIAAAVALARIWLVDVLALVPPAAWADTGRSLATAGFMLWGAYVLWQVARFHIDRYLWRHPAPGNGFDADDVAQAPTAATRLRTMMPVLRVGLATLLLVVTGFAVLSELGVDTAPLIAGASILGLAISFGSQTLVKDVVSGIFYLADDAFRVGEYIDASGTVGTVEGFTVRSLRLRHHNGQIHTIPFGQLGSITNFSRDWTTVKFNLKVARGTDLELLRKVAKKVGLAMMEDPELKGDLLQPLKLQGIVDITETALIARFKFTVRPGNPALVQRQGLKRLYEAFAKASIDFAQSTVAIQTLGAPPEAAAAAALAGARPTGQTAA